MLMRFVLVLVVGFAGCSRNPVGNDSANTGGELRVGTAPPGGAFYLVGEAITMVLHESNGGKWQASAQSTKGSLENIEALNEGRLELALANAATTFFAAAEGYPMQAIMTLAPNVAMFVTRADSGLKTIEDLSGKRVFIGPKGAGFELFLMPIFVAHDSDFPGIQPVHGSQMDAVRMLVQGEVDAAFLGGAIPTESIIRASEAIPIRFIPYEELPARILKQEFVFYTDAIIPAGTYPAQTTDFHGMNVGSMHLITSAKMDEGTIYEVTKQIYENRAQIAQKHPAGLAIRPNIVVQDTGTPFHPGAIRYYQEIGIWPSAR
jgi:uncharacterized protein